MLYGEGLVQINLLLLETNRGNYIMRAFFSLLLSLIAITVSAQEHLNLKDGLAIDGYDPVSYHQEGPVRGGRDFSLDYGGATYRFVSRRNLELFQSDPERYLPEYGGYCAYAMLEGDKVKIDPESYKLIDGKLYLFYDGLFGDTLKRWNKLALKQPEADLVNTADRYWQETISSE